MNSGHSLLVVDDDVDTCRNLSDILADMGYRVDTAQDGRKALELVRENAYDVALLDLKMPDLDGLTLYREIKKLSAGTVAIIVTAYAGSTTLDEARASGALQVLPKPIDLPRLLGVVHRALDQPLLLVVDDDRDLCANLWDLFREQGYRACLAHDEKDAADLLKDRAFKVVLIDMKLPGGDGTSVFRLVRESHPDTRTILITGFRSEMDHVIQKVLAEGADALCYKPFDIPGLLNTLQQLARDEKKGTPG